MAVLQKIRNKGTFLVGIVGLALFAFIAEEAVRSFQSTANESRQQVGEVLGESLSVQDFNALVEEYSDFIKSMQGVSQLDEQQMAGIRDQVWQNYVTTKLIENECKEVGLTVTDAEVQSVISRGNHQLLAQLPFRSSNGKFDVSQLRDFINQYDNFKSNPTQIDPQMMEQYESVYKAWKFIEKQIHQDLLIQKYNSALMSSAIVGKSQLEAAYEARSTVYNVVTAALPYSSIDDSEVKVEDSDLKSKYNEMKEVFKNNSEIRVAEIISVNVSASQADREALTTEMTEVAANISQTDNVAKFVRESGSELAYSTMPVSKKNLPLDIQNSLDSIAVGSVVGPFVSSDNTMNVVRLIAKSIIPDSVECRTIGVSDRKTADSIIAAIQGGAPFDTIASKYNQQGAKIWITGQMYEGQTLDTDNGKYLKAVVDGAVGSLQAVEIGQGTIVLNITDRRAMTEKYDVAIVKKSIDFSRDTYTEKYNQLSQFLAENKTASDIRKNSISKGYFIQKINITSDAHNVANVSGTREVLRWIFDGDRDTSDVSPLYEVGNNDNLMVVILSNVIEKGYASLEQEDVKSYVRMLVQNDKRAAILQNKIADMNIDQVAKQKGASVDTINHITFAGNVYVPSLGVSERSIAGSIAGKKVGDLIKAVKGDAGVYTFKVLSATKDSGEFNAKSEAVQAQNQTFGAISQNLIQRLIEKANVKDNRYLFY